MTPRGGLKLEAALARFSLFDAIRGARAVDVGASTGGFTGTLLRHGAVEVTAVDVGHGQLLPALRGDPRVVSLERADWKNLSLRVAPGPFDFFTVDVSFVSARNMLRSLAFRLRDGARGVVLVKPQFELPAGQVRGAEVPGPELRARALGRFRDKAEALGFEVLDSFDSPVAGGSGTIEILALLRFEGRAKSLPARGESRGQAARSRPGAARAGSGGASKSQKVQAWFAVAAPGLEEPVRVEVERLAGATRVTAVAGGVSFDGPLEVGMRANLHLRVATRILLRMGEVAAREFAPLRRRVSELPWEAVLPPGRAVTVSAAASRCRLYHTGALTETVEHAISDRLGGGRAGSDAQPAGAARVLIRGLQDRFVLSVDSSGELLHRRGWRLEAAEAPMRETLAAGLLALCAWEPGECFVDPMCGSGTIALEAAALAVNRAPGLGRSFAFEAWPGFDAGLWERLRGEATAAIADRPSAPLFAFDRDARQVAMARRNAERAGLLPHVTIEEAAFGEKPAPARAGLVLCNPPYGHRLGGQKEAARLAREMGHILRNSFAGWRAGVVLLDQRLAKSIGRPVRPPHKLANGGLRISLCQF
jgi:putative N6-adenine-specific DNA methylase